MPKTISNLTGWLLLSLLVLVACNRQAAQQAAADRHWNTATALTEQAHQGFVPASDRKGTDEGLEFQSWRQAKLSEALAELEQVVASGSDAQSTEAHKLMAKLHTSAAGFMAQQASTESASLAADSTELVSFVRAADRAIARLRLFETAPISEISDLEDAIKEQADELKLLHPARDGFEAQRRTQQEKVDALKQQAHAHMAETRELQDQAFVADGPMKYELSDQAAEAKRLADQTHAQAAKHEVNRDGLDRALTVVRSRIVMINEYIVELNKSIKHAQEQQNQNQKSEAEAQQVLDEAVQGLTYKFERIKNEFVSEVDQKLDQAGQRIDQAIKSIEHAAKVAKRSGDRAQSRAVAEDQLSARLSKANIKTTHVLAMDSYKHLVEVPARISERLNLACKEVFASELAAIDEKRRALMREVMEVIQISQDLATNDPESLVLIESYSNRLNGEQAE